MKLQKRFTRPKPITCSFFRSIHTVFFLSVLLHTDYLFSQQLDNIELKHPLKLNGYIAANQVVNVNSANPDQNYIYTGYYSGSLIFDVYGLSLPLTYVYSNQNSNFSHPFNQFGLHPSYKWIKAHIGYTSMSFSPYTLGGHLFNGFGIEANPYKTIKLSAMYGTFCKAVGYDTSKTNNTPTYKRTGYGFKAGWAKDRDFVEVIFFKAKDVQASIDIVPDSLLIYPQENSIVSLCVGKSFFKNFVFTGEYATSALTRDIRAEEDIADNQALKPALWFVTERTTTIYRTAMKARLTYNKDNFSVGAGFERVDPDYTTFGSYYFTNNLENYTLNGSVNLWQNKINLSANAGLQKDNLDGSEMNNNNRFVGSANVGIVPGEKLSMNLSYSNFLSYTNVRSSFDYINETNPYENWDTLNYRQISQNINFSGNYQFTGNEERRQSVSLNLTYQNSNDVAGDSNNISNFYNAGIAYIFGLKPYNLNVSATLNYNLNDIGIANTCTWGPGLTLSKMFFKRILRTSLNYSYNTTATNGNSTGDVNNLRFSNVFVFKKKHNFNISMLYQLRHIKSPEAGTRSDKIFTLTFGYAYNFSLWQNKKEKNRNDGQDKDTI